MRSTTLPPALVGDWLLDRRILDRRSGEWYAVSGTTRLAAADPGRIVWTERGVMTWASGTTPVERELSVAEDDRGDWAVSFADGRRFFAWEPDAPIAHACGSDAYRARMGFVRSPAGEVVLWAVRWDAEGPAKDYRSVSILRRAAGPQDATRAAMSRR